MIGKLLTLLGAIALAQAASVRADPLCSSLQFDNKLTPHEDCGKFYQCSNGVPVVHKCVTGLHFNSDKQVCDIPEDAKCRTNVDSPSYEAKARAECLAVNSESLLLPHENCNQFYKCSHGAPVEQNCPYGLNYDPAKLICNWASGVDCGDRKSGANK